MDGHYVKDLEPARPGLATDWGEIALTDAVVTVRCEDFRAAWVHGGRP